MSPVVARKSFARLRAVGAYASPVQARMPERTSEAHDGGWSTSPESIVPWSSMCIREGHANCAMYCSSWCAWGSCVDQSTFSPVFTAHRNSATSLTDSGPYSQPSGQPPPTIDAE